MSDYTLDLLLLGGIVLAWFGVPCLTAFFLWRLLGSPWWRRKEQAVARNLTDEQSRLARQLRAEKAGERVELGYGSFEEVADSIRRAG